MKNKLKESTFSILPIVVIVLLLCIFVVPTNIWTIIAFLLCSCIFVVGMSLFTIGADMAMMKIGGYVGSHLSKSRKIWNMLLYSFIIGVIATIAEPDLSVLAMQFPGLEPWIFILTIGLGVGIFMILAIFRILFKIKLNIILTLSYILVFVLMFFTPENFLPVSFDVSGVTTGPISVPLIMALGLGISSVRSGKSNEDDGFGLLALSSVGPIIAVMVLSIILKGNFDVVPSDLDMSTITNASMMFSNFGTELLNFLGETALLLLPIALFFYFYQIVYLKFPKQIVIRVGIGLIYTFLGIVLFLTAVTVGFLPIAIELGLFFGGLSNTWILVPVGFVIGFIVVSAEPAVRVLNKQIEDLTGGAIKAKFMLMIISIGVGIAVALSMIRNIFEINFIYFVVPIFAVSLILSFYNSNFFTSVAFDSGGVVSGAMSSTFVLPFTQGVAVALGNDLMIYGFATIALISSVPILVIQIVGAIYKYKITKIQKVNEQKKKQIVKIYEFEV